VRAANQALPTDDVVEEYLRASKVIEAIMFSQVRIVDAGSGNSAMTV